MEIDVIFFFQTGLKNLSATHPCPRNLQKIYNTYFNTLHIQEHSFGEAAHILYFVYFLQIDVDIILSPVYSGFHLFHPYFLSIFSQYPFLTTTINSPSLCNFLYNTSVFRYSSYVILCSSLSLRFFISPHLLVSWMFTFHLCIFILISTA